MSQTAPYSHFKNRDDLLAAVAAHGFEDFVEAMTAQAGDATDASERILSFGVGYVAFAWHHPALYRLMFQGDRELLDANPALAATSAMSFQLIEEGVAEVLGKPDHDAAIAAWAMVHGLAELMLSGRVEPADSENERREQVERVLAFLL